jgi:hypothetical protein
MARNIKKSYFIFINTFYPINYNYDYLLQKGSNMKLVSNLFIVVLVSLVNSATVGRTESTGTSSSNVFRCAQRVTMPEAGTITSLHFYHAGTGAQVVVGIYGDNAGSPGNLIQRSNIVGVETAGWQQVNVSPVGLSANQVIWLAWCFYSAPGIVYTTNAANGFRYFNGSAWTGDPNTIMPTSFGTASTTYQSREYSVYATYIPGLPPPVPPSQFWSQYSGSIYTTSNVEIFPPGGDGIELTGDNGMLNRIRSINNPESHLVLEANQGVNISDNATSSSIDVGGSYNRIHMNVPLKIGGLDGEPTSQLEVAGTISADAVKIKNWTLEVPDYVFDKEYDLPTLKTLDENIVKEKHLPGIPSASEMKEKGVDLSNLNMMLLKKVEELTLYLIEQNKKMEALEKKVGNYEKK